ncbi:MAG: DUF4124 domain-containing protein [Betaproteobacteria bacterium]|nr:DUF4124 domain-containing protein [Betaproteobacteria bacterium]
MRIFIVTALAAASVSSAFAQGVYRCTDASGRTIYTDEPKTGNCVSQKLEAPADPAAGKAPGLREGERQLLEQANARAAMLDSATADVVTAFNALRAAEARRDQGVEPLEGERSGRRFRREYVERQQALQRDVDEAQAQLDAALARRNALR